MMPIADKIIFGLAMLLSLGLIYIIFLIERKTARIRRDKWSFASKPSITKRKDFMSQDAVEAIQKGLLEYFDKKLHLRKNVKLAEVASDLKIQPYILSAFVNHHYQMRFNDVIDFHRIQHVKNELINKRLESYTLERIAELSGFANTTTFLNAFKKFTGLNPSAFMSEIVQQSKERDQQLKEKDQQAKE